LSPTSGQGDQQGTPILQQTQQKAGEVMDRARSQVTEQLESQKQRATGALSGLAQALRQTGEQLEQQNQAPLRQYAESAAEAVDRFSGYLSERDVPQMIGSVENFARYQPAMFLGGAFVLGLFAARFLKSSGPGNGSASSMSGIDHSSYPASTAWSTPTSTMDAVGTYRTAGSPSGVGTPESDAAAITTIRSDSSFTGEMDEEDELLSASGSGANGNRSEATE